MKYMHCFLTFCVILIAVTFPASSLLFGQTVTPATTSYNFGRINVCPFGKTTPAPCSANYAVSFNVTAGTTIGGIAIVLGGAPNLDYKAEADDSSKTLCTAKFYSETTTCSVNVTFAPLASGGRNGAVEILKSGGGVLATSYISGIGVGPQVAFSPAAQISHAVGGDPGFDPLLVAIDGGGNVFFSAETNSLEELTAASGYNEKRVLTTDLDVVAMAVDGAGNLFLVDIPEGERNEEVRELFMDGTYTTSKVLIRDIEFSLELALDGAGNLFMVGFDGLLREYFVAGGYATSKTLARNYGSATQGIAIDGSGNIFAVGQTQDAVKELVAAGGYTTSKTLSFGFEVDGLAVDAAGNLFVVATGLGLVEIEAASGYATSSTLLNNKFPTGVAVDAYGNIFTSNIYKDRIVELLRSQPPSLQFAPTAVDGSSSNGPLWATAQNIGNAPLTASGLTFTDSTNFTHAVGSSAPPDCTSSISLSPGAECNLGIDFAPAAAGMLAGSVDLTDNSGNAIGATQSIALSGNGITAGGPVAYVSATALSFGSIALHSTATKLLTITNTGGGKLMIYPSTNGPSYKITGSTCTEGVTTGSCVLQVEFDPLSIGAHPVIMALKTNGPTNPTIALTGTGTGVGAGAFNGVQKLSPITSLDFGTIDFPSISNIREFFIYDVGVPGSVAVQVSIHGPDYKIATNDCATQGVTQYGCFILVEFSPLTRGGHWETLTLTPSVGIPSTIELTGIAGGTVP